MSREERTLVTTDDGTTMWDDGVAYDTAKPFRCHWPGCEKAFRSARFSVATTR